MSLLGYDGSPIEFSVSTLSANRLGCTIDPFIQQPGRSVGLDAVLSYSKEQSLGVSASDLQLTSLCQSGGSLTFGSWLGMKYSVEGRKLKVYSEVPRDLPAGHLDLFGGLKAIPVVTTCNRLRLLMIGYDPGKNGVELYYEWHSGDLDKNDVCDAMGIFEWDDHFSALSSLVDDAVGLSVSDDGFPGTTYGFSVSMDETGVAESFSLFAMSRSFFGDDRSANLALRQVVEKNGWELPLFRAIRKENLQIRHNVFGATVTAEGRTGLSFTFSPDCSRFVTKRFSPVVHRTGGTSRGATDGRFLPSSQLSNGAFASYVFTPDKKWQLDANGFVTAQVLRLIDGLMCGETCIERALDFLESCACKKYRYAFWPASGYPEWMHSERLPADIDDTALITEILYKFGRISLSEVDETLDELDKFRLVSTTSDRAPWHVRGVYQTWMSSVMKLNIVDCCVNTNLLPLLVLTGRREGISYKAIIEMLRRALEFSNGDYDRLCTVIPYYAHPFEWLLALIHAQSYGIPELSPLIEILGERWSLVPFQNSATPLYCRHDGRYLWVSPCLSSLRR